MKLLPLAILAALVLTMSAAAAPTRYHLIEGDLSITDIVLQQSPSYCHPPIPEGTDLSACVRNSLRAERCMWNLDDFWTVGAVGRKIEAGVVASASVCRVEDWRLDFWGISVRAAKPLDVTLTFATQGVTFRIPGLQVSKDRWEAKGCMHGPAYVGRSYPLEPIEGSNGGIGILNEVTFTVANPTSKFIADPSAIIIERPGSRNGYCAGERMEVERGGAIFWLYGPVPVE